MKTKGALIWEFNQPWSIEEIEIGDPQEHEVKIQMEAAGMCHSDHHLVTGGIPMAGFPVLGGHEGAGIVTEVGPGVEDIAPGDHVVLSFIPSCGQCPTCQAGMRNLCDLGRRAAGRRRGLRRHVPHPGPRPGRLPDDAAGHVLAVHGGASQLGGEDRPVGPVRGGRPGRLRRHHRLRLGGSHRRHPAGPRRRHRRRRRGRHGSAAGRRQRRRALHLRDRPGRVEARPGAEIRCHPRLPGHQRRADGHHGGHLRPDGSQGRGHGRRAARRRHRQLPEHHPKGRHLRADRDR